MEPFCENSFRKKAISYMFDWLLNTPLGLTRIFFKIGRYKTNSANCSWLAWIIHKSSVIRQKGESQNGCYKKTKHAKFSEKQTFLTPWYAHVSVLFGVLCFLVTPILKFALLPYYRRNIIWTTEARFFTVSIIKSNKIQTNIFSFT